MSNIANFILCRECTNTRENGCSAKQILISIPVLSFPSTISFAIVITFVDIHNTEKISIDLVDPEERVIITATGEIKGEKHPTIPDLFHGLHTSLRFNNITVSTEGEYKFIVKSSDCYTEIGRKSFYVYRDNVAKGE